MRVIADFVTRFADDPAELGRAQNVRSALKKRGGNPVAARMSRIAGVAGLGPSSNVRAIALRPGGPCQTDGPKTCDDRPRTAQAIAAIAASGAEQGQARSIASQTISSAAGSQRTVRPA